ncbi:hypothetical protein [Spiroplasma endosymbiont of Ammophila pubescens]|uniref:hypothetical protein n=1 Tax=Spiroplasma endosymbiont of Ammophila pubescens TaxID=3066315 RepID=UPI0032B1E809
MFRSKGLKVNWLEYVLWKYVITVMYCFAMLSHSWNVQDNYFTGIGLSKLYCSLSFSSVYFS